MESSVTPEFRQAFEALPTAIQQKARAAYRLWRDNPRHPSLRFKRVHVSEPIFSVRIDLGWRALAVVTDERALWFWIGSHADYDKLLSQRR